ncbi:hypothetical protein A1Q2_06052 [Trichosporon asahii var. asahii CBS 8904]|uniref:RING-type domain-containing protein n=1 Tax=Trichosporon asahii var. asahii (strain CBS 8904) TaxID=1220162 RepID=K1WDG7_TRIAC|nr:hypothetical protein A1Q2_06052 [Trichosporon asahii var. asahii CBS 8904]
METDTRLGLIRSRDEFDASCGSESSSPHRSKSARTSLASTASSSPGDLNDVPTNANNDTEATEDRTADALVEELECGMCAGVFIEPVALNGCGHVFCGSCVMQWIKSMPKYPPSLLPGDPVPEPISCPHCRHAPVQTATPCRLAKTMVGILLASRPDVARPPNEHRQAELLYKSTTGVIKRPANCNSTNSGVRAVRVTPRKASGGVPSRFLASRFRLNVIDAFELTDSVPRATASAPDGPLNVNLLCRDNWTEMYHLGIYLGNNEHMSAQYIYKQILEWLRTPEGLDSGGILAMMNRADINLRLRTGMADEMQQAVMSAGDSASESRICGGCADEILCWWMRELKKPEALQARPADVRNRPNCKFGRTCSRQDSDDHAKKYNHICDALPEDEARTMHQDDILPAQENAPEQDNSGAESDDGGSDDENEIPSNFFDAGTQWEATVVGVEMTCHTNGLNSAWVNNTGAAYASSTSTTSTQAFSIANLVNETSGPPSSADTPARAAQAPTWQAATNSQPAVLGLRSSHQGTHQANGYPTLFDSVGSSMSMPLSSKLPPLQTGSKLPSLFDMPEASTSARKLDSSSMDVEQQ